MNKSVFFIFILLFSFSCGKKEEVKFEAFSPEAFAYDIGEAWEVNATVNVRGFEKIKKDDETFVSLSYNVDLINSDGDSTKNIFSDLKEVSNREINDIQLEAQFELDDTQTRGTYKIVFNIKDNNSSKTVSAQVEFELED
ncbi:MAG: hypothetical protein OEM46_04075 [Ignavibacteria bacterium]|nr:hypothetical protein [Ignavibacteria bacterium]